MDAVNVDGVNMDTVSKKIKAFDNVFVYGCGLYGQFLFENIVALETGKAINFCETIPNYKSVLGAEVLSPEEILVKYPNALFIIGSPANRESMVPHLAALGVADSNIFSAFEIEKQFKLRKHPRLPNLLFTITEHCNLNCASCLKFASVSEKEFADLRTIKNDLIRLNEIFSGDIYSIGLFGGEPLLHPQIEDIVETVRQILPNAIVSILTNGILLANMPESFWKTIKKNNVCVYISRYPINLDTNRIKKKAEAFGAYVKVSEFRKESWQKHILDLKGRCDPEESFIACPFANGQCITISKGRLYPCITINGARQFNQKFGQNLELTNEDSVDLYSDVTAQDIFDFLASPVPFCRYCDIKKRRKIEWSLSKSEIGEFVEYPVLSVGEERE